MAKGIGKSGIFDKHHKMERFGVLFIVLFSLLAAFFVAGYRTKKVAEKFVVTDKALYTTQAKWSLTGQEINIKNIYRNTDSTRVLLVLSMNEESMKEFSTNANDYKVFIVSAEDTGKVTHDIHGTCYVFGDTGRIGILFSDPKSFEKGLAHILLRNEAQISSKPNVFLEFDEAKTSFENFNQIEIMANLGGNEAIKAASLDDVEIDVTKMYLECVVPDKYDEVKTECAAKLDELNTKSSLMFEQKRRLSSYGFSVPFPTCLLGDKLTGKAENTVDNPYAFTASMLSDNTSKIDTDYNSISDDTSDVMQRYVANNDVRLKTSFVFPGGVQFDYQKSTFDNLMINSVMVDTSSYENWRSLKKAESEEYVGYTWFSKNVQWFLNGTEYIAGDATYDKLGKTYDDTITEYTNCVNDVIDCKKEYQKETLYKLLDFEYFAKMISKVVSINDSDNFVYVSK